MLKKIKSVFSPMNAMKIEPNEKQLQTKLHLITQHLINSSKKQFDAWMELQTNNQLHHTIQQIYQDACKEGSQYTEEQLCSIYQFYTLLLINSQDQLLVCKLVSDDLVIKLCRMEGVHESKYFQVDAYRINLIKAYLGNATHQAIKYMVVQDQFKVFLQCVKLYQGKAGTVEQTTIANSILNIIHKVNDLPFLWESVWVDNGLKSLYVQCFGKIKDQLAEADPEDLQQTILFLVQLGTSISQPVYKQSINQFCHKQMDQIVGMLQSIDINIRLRDICLLFGLYKKSGFQELMVTNFLQNWLDDALYKAIELCHRDNPIDQLNFMTIFLLNKIVQSSFSHLSDREYPSHNTPQQNNSLDEKRKHIMSILMKVLQQNIKIAQNLTSKNLNAIYMGYIKQLLQATFHLRIVLYPSPQQQNKELSELIIQLFKAHTLHYKNTLQNKQDLDSMIHWYQEGSTKATKQLLQIHQIFQHIKQNPLNITLLTFQYIRNFRYMIAETTSLDPKSIRQQKFHHTTFSSVGMTYHPNTLVEAGLLSAVTPCIIHHNYHQIPAVIAEDRECFIVAYKVQNDEYKILINIKFTDIENFVYGDSKSSETKSESDLPKYVRINLRGSQQIVLQFANPQISGIKFKQYLTRSKENSRERQITFLKSWVQIYEKDTIKSLQLLGKVEKQGGQQRKGNMQDDEDQYGL